MSCNESEKAQAEARAERAQRKSLPIVNATAGAPTAAGRPWRSIEERQKHEQRPSALALGNANEFPPGASELQGVSRRGFMQMLGASTAIATVGACSKPNEKIIPFIRRPEEVTPGNPLHFATGYALDGYIRGLLVESHEGRPTKVEGNPSHPETLGATGIHDQALILGLYDDDRAKQLRKGAVEISWTQIQQDLRTRSASLAADGGVRLRFLTGPTTSPLLADLRRRILERFPRAKFVSYGSVEGDGAALGGKLAFGHAVVPRHRLTPAAIIVSLDADFLGEGPEQLRLMREFADRREPSRDMSRIYVVEPSMTVTGMNADHRVRVRGGDVPAFAAALCSMLANRGLSALGPVGALGQGGGGWDPKVLVAIAADLERNRGRAVVIAGRRQPPIVHALAAALNVALGNVGSTVDYGVPLTTDPMAGVTGLGTLVEEIAAGGVDTLVITAENPVYGAPADFKLGRLLERVPNVVYHALYEDETARTCNYFIPATHPLETWGDGRSADGVVTLVQPLIAPLWGAKTESEVLATFVGDGGLSAHELLRGYWRGMGKLPGNLAGAFDSVWERWLADGIVPDTGAGAETGLTINGAALAQAAASELTPKGQGLEIAFAPDPKLYDGRFANNAWLQELPHPVTKASWDNALMLSDATAKSLGIDTGDVVQVTYRERALEAPAMIVPGHADDAITLPLGYGRTAGGHYGRDVGFNANELRTSDAPWFDRGATLNKTGKSFKFALTQQHWEMSPDGRDIPPPAVAAPLAEVLKQGSAFNDELDERRGPLPTIHKPVDYSAQAYKWGMSIDLSRCTGCHACVVACQSENNIPTVGKHNVALSREMHWLRIDRYFEGSVADPEVVNQPLMCVHCETAPCEYVCPVNATVHSDEGLNEMVYNRCIGTRYCSNNCPYKVRRFNFLNYTADVSPARKLGMNPDVTVRSRGVMEKCTYCVQRIERARISTRIEGRTIQDGELQTACQQGCPTRAIEFGSLNDPNSKVSKQHADPRRYFLLHEIGTRPRTVYLARVRNPNPDLVKVD
jgi:Fe-S-cluster-containing dehydrogenase component